MLDGGFGRRRWWRPTGYQLTVAALVIVTVVMAALWAAAYSDERQFDGYRGCLPVCTGTDISETSASVIDAGSRSGKHRSYWLDVGGAGTGVDRIVMADNRGVWPAVATDDTVMIVYWRTTPVEVRFADLVSETQDNPDLNAAHVLAGLVYSTTVLLFLIWIRIAARGYRRGLAAKVLPFSVFLVGVPYAIWVTVARKTVFYPLPLIVASAGVVVVAIMLITGARMPWKIMERGGAGKGLRR